MWIQTQNKQRIVNSDQIIDIFVDKSGTKIMAEVTWDGDFFTLGEYKDRDACLNVLGVMKVVISQINCRWLNLPLGGDIENWIKELDEKY